MEFIQKCIKKYTDGRRVTYVLVNLVYNLGGIFALGWASSFLTDVLDYSAVTVATALMLGRAMDVVASSLTGPLIQHFNPSGGKRDGLLSWAILLEIFFVISLITMFCDTRVFGTAGVWVSGLLYGIFAGVADMIQGVFYSMMGVMAGSDQAMRNELSIASTRGNKFGLLLMSMTALPMVTYFSTSFNFTWEAYTCVAAIYSFAMVAGMSLFSHYYAIGVSAPPALGTDKKAKEESFWGTCKALFQNKYLRAILISDIFYYTGMMTVSNLGIYYFRLMGEFGPTYTMINTIIDVAAIIGIFVLPMLGIRLGKKISKTLWLLLYGVSMILFTFIGERSVWIFGIIKIVTQTTMMLWNFYLVPYLLDAAEAYLYETGVDTRLSAPATIQIAADIGNITGGAIAGYGLAVIGYDAIDLVSLSNVTPVFMRSFLALFGIGGILMIIAAFVWIKFYKITDTQADFYAKENTKRNSKPLSLHEEQSFSE